MKLKDEIIRRIDRMMYHTWKEDEPVRTWHSGFYHNYFDGYRENKVSDEKGKHKKVERFYAGCYYLIPKSATDFIGRKCIYALLLFGSVGLYYISCFTDQLAANFSTAVSVMQCLDIFAFLWLVYIFACSILAGRRMTSGDYKSTHIRMIQVSLAGSLSLAATALAKLIYAAFENALDIRHLQNAAILVLASAFLWVIHLMEEREKFDVEESELSDKAGIEIS